jgi:hypothetical protein
MQREARPLLLDRVGFAVQVIADDRMTDPGEVNAQLMRASGQRL